MPEKTPFRYPEYSFKNKFTSDSWQLKHINLHHREHLQITVQKNPMICSTPQRIEPTRRGEFNSNKISVEALHVFPYLKHVESITDSISPPMPHPLPRKELYPGTGAPLSDSISDLRECNAQGGLQMNLHNNPYNTFAKYGEYKYIQWEIKNKGMKMYCDNVLKEEDTPLRFPSFKHRNGIYKLVASMPGDQALGEWELHSLEDMEWNHNHQQPIKYWSRDMIKSCIWLKLQSAYAEYHIYAHQGCPIINTPSKRLYTEMYTTDWQWATQGWRDTRE
jgi:hypothetical protein